jgi:hypothetical protein
MSQLIEGVEIKLGAETYTVPALSIGQVRRLLPKIKAMRSVANPLDIDDEQWRTMLEIILAALQRNYPNVTSEMLEDIVDARNMRQLFPAIMGQSGLEGNASGEKLARS